MTTRWIATMALAGAVALAGCGASGGSDDEAGAGGDTTSTEAPATTDAPATTEATTTSEATTTEVDPTTTTSEATDGELPPCQELLQQYAAAFDPDDMSEVIALFRSWAPNMPADVGAATTRLADAYEAVDGDLGGIDMTDVDLTADAETFSDWTNEGCPPG
jgi:hypothetical protein